MSQISDLIELLERGDVFYNIQGDSPEEALRAFAKVVRAPKPLDRKVLADALVEREGLATTAIGEGFAIPHPRQRMLQDEAKAFIAVGYLDSPIPWDSPDGKPVSLLFLVVSANSTSHLSVLSGIASLMGDQQFKEFMAKKPEKSKLITYLRSKKT